ncbi:MAG: Txe/YoeB family addiction module toxin [Clostridium sp.]|nr:Txe/YoeB family addiction module toxin [Clostridium sp.]
MRLLWEDRAWEDYLYWQTQDKKALKRINSLISEIKRTPFEGMGKPEPLRGSLSGYWSRRIDEVNRIVYFEQDNTIYIISCKGHYDF